MPSSFRLAACRTLGCLHVVAMEFSTVVARCRAIAWVKSALLGNVTDR
jgi:hypothetical protein